MTKYLQTDRGHFAKWRFQTKHTQPAEGCWIWKAGFRKGYGAFKINGKTPAAQRVAYEIHIGPIPKNMNVLHKCDNKACVNPDHLFLGTNGDNNKDRNNKGRSRGYLGVSLCH